MVYPLSFVATSPHHHFHLSVIHANGTSKQCILSKKMFVFHISVHYLLCFAPPSRISLAWLFIITAHILACIFNVHVELDLPEDCHTYDWHVCQNFTFKNDFHFLFYLSDVDPFRCFFCFKTPSKVLYDGAVSALGVNPDEPGMLTESELAPQLLRTFRSWDSCS